MYHCIVWILFLVSSVFRGGSGTRQGWGWGGGGGGTILFIFVVVEYTAFIGRGPGVAKALAGSRGSAPVDISCISKGYLMASPDTLIGNFKAGKCNTAHYCQCISFLLLFLFRMSGGSAHDALHCIFFFFFFFFLGGGVGGWGRFFSSGLTARGNFFFFFCFFFVFFLRWGGWVVVWCIFFVIVVTAG